MTSMTITIIKGITIVLTIRMVHSNTSIITSVSILIIIIMIVTIISVFL